MVGFLSIVVSGFAGYGAHVLCGDHLSIMGDFWVSTLVSGAVYVATLIYLKRLRGDL